MVDFIGIDSLQRLVARTGLAAFIGGLAREIAADYQRWDAFDKTARHAMYSAAGVIELMPISDGTLYACKYVNGHPANTRQGLLTVTAFGVLADVRTGYPLLLSELTVTTALRTAAMSALVAQHLARPDSRVMAVIGNGAQSEFQALAFHELLGIQDFRLYDVDAAATDKLARHLSALGLRFTRCGSTAEAVHGADIVTTLTADKHKATILSPDMIAPGMHLNAVGGDSPGKTELHPDILRRPDARVVVEFAPQSRVEGDIQQLPADFAVTEFARVLRGEAAGRVSRADITIFDSVGFALEDFSALRYLHQLHTAQHTASRIDLIPALGNPKDLFGLLAAPPGPHHTAAPQRRQANPV